MKRPPIEEFRKWPSKWPHKTIKSLCDYIERLEAEIEELRGKASDARVNAKVLAFCYERDVRPPGPALRKALAYPVEAGEGLD